MKPNRSGLRGGNAKYPESKKYECVLNQREPELSVSFRETIKQQLTNQSDFQVAKFRSIITDLVNV